MKVEKLVTERLCKSYTKQDVKLEVLRDISLSVRDGEFVSIVGASGCGKTTFLRLVDGLITPTSGSVRVDGREVTLPGKEMAFVFQQDGLFPWRTVLNNTVLGPELQGRSRREYKEQARQILKLVGLAGFENHYPHELSGGMRQRVNIGRALAIGADILLMDEPFAALDAQTRTIMQDELIRIWRETKKTVLFVTHQLEEAVYLSDRVFVFTARPGRLKEIIEIDLPRPRSLDIKWTKEFVDYTNHIWTSIEEEVRMGIGLEIEKGIN
ncbi:ABC transporter ATP-binding protein [Castellaniella sp. GW247-6E4]|uniref:ABC transporter ATP-binding protein n=1 Tax=Castellaniella sp. GW247-6E4 TaxID=3140380 RepID=UPI003315D20B